MPDHARNIHERFLRHIWSRQYLDESRLRTCDGKSVRVLDVGRLNLDGGPDFTEARIKIGGVTFAGDVEIHRTVPDWFSHQHQSDPRYNRVILHVVLEADPRKHETTSLSGRTIPVLVLSDFLAESIQSIWQKAILDERARRSETIRCFDKNRILSDTVLAGWLRKLTLERLELKLRKFEERLKELAYEHLMAVQEHPKTYGELPVEDYPEEIPPPLRELNQRDFSRKELWEQILYEGLMEGLGYAKNREPFLRLARSVTLRQVRDLGLVDDSIRREAVLFAVAGLLPKIKAMKERESKEYVRSLIRAWNGVRSTVRVAKLQASDWQFFPTRPNNFPTLRIGAANALLSRLLNEDLFRSVIQVIKSTEDPGKTRMNLVRVLSVRPGDFWSHHYDFDQPTRTTMVALGQARVQELIVNTVVPIALLYARIFKDTRVRERTLRFYEQLPSSEENALTRLMEQQLLRKKILLDTAAKQQGAIHLYKYYCTEGRCTDCEIGGMLFGVD